MQCLVLAGGLATRMRPITETIPKSLIAVHGTPFAHYQLKKLAADGVTEVVFSIGYLGEQIREFVGDGSRWGLKVRYVDEGRELRGTGGAIRLAVDSGVMQERFLVTYGDSFLPVDTGAVWRRFSECSEPALMTVLENGEKWDSSNACFDGSRVTLYDKKISPKPKEMRYIDYGMMGLERSVIESGIPRDTKVDLADLLSRLSREGKLAGMEVSDRFYEIGSPSGLRDFENLVNSIS